MTSPVTVRSKHWDRYYTAVQSVGLAKTDSLSPTNTANICSPGAAFMTRRVIQASLYICVYKNEAPRVQFSDSTHTRSGSLKSRTGWVSIQCTGGIPWGQNRILFIIAILVL